MRENDIPGGSYWFFGLSIFLLLAALAIFAAMLGNLLGLWRSTTLDNFWQTFHVLNFYLPGLLFAASRALLQPAWFHAFALLSFAVLPLVTLNGIFQILLSIPSNFNLWLAKLVSPAVSLWLLSGIFVIQALFLLHPAFRNFLLHWLKWALRSFREAEYYPELDELSPNLRRDRGIMEPEIPAQSSFVQTAPTKFLRQGPAALQPHNTNEPLQKTWSNNSQKEKISPEPQLRQNPETLQKPDILEQQEPSQPSNVPQNDEQSEEASELQIETQTRNTDNTASFPDFAAFSQSCNNLEERENYSLQELPNAKNPPKREEDNIAEDSPFEFPIEPVPDSWDEQVEPPQGNKGDPGFDILATDVETPAVENIAQKLDPVELAFEQANRERPPFFTDGKPLPQNLKSMEVDLEQSRLKEPYEPTGQRDTIRQEKILLRIQEADKELADEDMADELLQREQAVGNSYREQLEGQSEKLETTEAGPLRNEEPTIRDDISSLGTHQYTDNTENAQIMRDSITKPRLLQQEEIEEPTSMLTSTELLEASDIREEEPLLDIVEETTVLAEAALEDVSEEEAVLLPVENAEWQTAIEALDFGPAEDGEVDLIFQKIRLSGSTPTETTTQTDGETERAKPVAGNEADFESAVGSESGQPDVSEFSKGISIAGEIVEKSNAAGLDKDFREDFNKCLNGSFPEMPDESPDDIPNNEPRKTEDFSVAEAAEQALREREARREQREEECAQKMLVPQIKHFRAYQAPVSSLINYDPEAELRSAQIDPETEESGEALLQTLKKFKITAQMTHILKGPSITEFGILPAPGIKLNRVEQLADNLAMELAARSIRIVAPIPGKKAVGIEIPNRRRSTVSFPALMDSEDMQRAGREMQLPILLGKEINGEIQIADLRQMPHLLIAGATGSGKSVCVNVIINSLILSRTPQTLRLLMIDPKIVELKQYNDIPHLLTPVIVDARRALQALQWVSSEMERRYALLDAIGAGNKGIESYNRYIDEKKMALVPLEFIVVIIDEFADLMSLVGKELEGMIARLAAMSRAVGIHLVLATQRPSVDVVTGLIKANFPTRIAFMVASQTDSRTILDQKGAEQLLGQGDMLFSFPGHPLLRIQGAYLAEDEAERISSHIKTLGEPSYLDEIIFEDDEDTHVLESGSDDLYPQAVEIALQAGEISTSFLQRRLSIGYNRAARIIDEMEARGVIGPAQGSKKREVLQAVQPK